MAAVSCEEIAGDIVPGESEELVPIKFELPTTKAGAIYGNEDLKDNKSYFGMFAVKTDAASLSESDELNIRNKMCRYVAPTETEKACLRFGYQSEDREYYFPMNSTTGYNFYTYHTWQSKLTELADGTVIYNDDDDIQTTSEMLATDKQAFVTIKLASPNDVIWAKSVAPEAFDKNGNLIAGYNAAYVRETGKVPSFNFSHPAAGIRFRAVLDENSHMQIPAKHHLRIKQISFTGAESRFITSEGILCIVDLNNPAKEGKFVASKTQKAKTNWLDPDKEGANATLNFDLLADDDGDGIVERCLTEPEQIFYEHFIMPMEEPMEVTIDLKREIVVDGTVTNQYTTVSKTFVLDPKDFGAAESGYKAGVMYNYKIVVKYTNPTPQNLKTDVIDIEIVADI